MNTIAGIEFVWAQVTARIGPAEGPPEDISYNIVTRNRMAGPDREFTGIRPTIRGSKNAYIEAMSVGAPVLCIFTPTGVSFWAWEGTPFAECQPPGGTE